MDYQVYCKSSQRQQRSIRQFASSSTGFYNKLSLMSQMMLGPHYCTVSHQLRQSRHRCRRIKTATTTYLYRLLVSKSAQVTQKQCGGEGSEMQSTWGKRQPMSSRTHPIVPRTQDFQLNLLRCDLKYAQVNKYTVAQKQRAAFCSPVLDVWHDNDSCLW